MSSYNYSVLKFKTEQDAREYFKTNDMFAHIDKLESFYNDLLVKSKTEVPQIHGHGYPLETSSGLVACYVKSEIDRLRLLVDYFNNVPPKNGTLWKWVDYGNGYVIQEIDKSCLDKKHPTFIKSVTDNNIPDHYVDDYYTLWQDHVLNPTIGGLFKLVYSYKMKELISDRNRLVKEGK